MSLFGSASASPFGTVGQQQQQPSSAPSLFTLNAPPTTQAPQASAPSPFGGLGAGASTAQSQPAASSFGGLGINSAAQFSQQAPAGSGLFAGLGTSAASTQTLPAASGMSSSFGGLGVNTSAQPAASGSSLFAGLGGTKPANSNPTPSLFASTTQTTQPSNLLGGTNATSASQSTGFNLFGGSKPTPAPLGTLGAPLGQSTFGASGQSGFGTLGQTGNGTLGQSAFGTSLLAKPSGQSSAEQNHNGQQSQLNLANSTTAHFHSMLERGKKTEGKRVRFGELPALELGLGDIASKVKGLSGSDFSASRRGADTRAQYILAASGVPRGSTAKDLTELQGQAAAATRSSVLSQNDTDLDAYVARIQAKSSADLFKESMEETKQDFESFLQDSMQINWDDQRRRVYEHFGLTKPSAANGDGAFGTRSTGESGANGAFGRSSIRQQNLRSSFQSPSKSKLAKSVLGGSTARGLTRGSLFSDVAEAAAPIGSLAAPDDPPQRVKQDRYAVKVKELNSARLQDLIYPVIGHFGQVETSADGLSPQHLIGAYRALLFITGENENAQRPSDPGAIREHQYATDYLKSGDSVDGRSLAMRKRILEGSKHFLESSFLQQVEDIVEKSPREANLGGIPTKLNKVRAYLRIRSGRKDLSPGDVELQMLGDDYCWALIFYLLRAGLVQEAAEYVADHDRAIRSMDRHFTQYMAAYARDPDRKLPRDMQSRINSEYQQRQRLAPEHSIDPYRMACYKIIGRCELNKKSLEYINTTLEDWLWVLFSLAREVNKADEAAPDHFGLDGIHEIVEGIGQRHFGASSEAATNYSTLFLLHILSGSFEQAVAWLYQHNQISAVHFAIVLAYYGLLRISDFNVSSGALLTYTTTNRPQIDFSRLIGFYTGEFRIARPEAATDYLVLIPLAAGQSDAGTNPALVCQEALKELVLETREFTLLLGDLRADGQKTKGAIDQRLSLISRDDQAEFLQDLTLRAAQVADNSGRVTDAVILYHLAEDYDKATAVIDRALSESLSVELGSEPMRLHTGTKQGARQQESDRYEGTSSLTTIDDPTLLARIMIGLYNADAMYFRKIRQINRDACGLLLRMSAIREKVETGKWADAIDLVEALQMLPMRAARSIPVIRSCANAFNQLPQVVARNVGHLLMWTILALGKQRDLLKASAFQTGRDVEGQLKMAAKDLMSFTGFIRFKLQPEVYEALSMAGEDL